MNMRKLVIEIDRDMSCNPDKGWIHRHIGEVAGLGEQQRLTSFLYHYYYQGLRGSNHYSPRPLGSAARLIESLEDKTLADQLAAALPSSFYYCPGWHLVARTDDTAIVERQGIQLSVTNHDWRQDTPHIQTVSVRMPTDSAMLRPAFIQVSAHMACRIKPTVRTGFMSI